MATLVEATASAQIATVRELFAEYARAVNEPRCPGAICFELRF